jgi:hypothetical protein
MAAGEYVSVHSQADTEQADLARERAELRADDKGEHKELMAIYVGRGLDPSLAEQVAGHCQLKRPWYAGRVGGAAARVGELLCSPIMLPRSSRAGPEKDALGPLS